MIAEIYIKGKYKDGSGAAAYVVVGEDKLVVHGAKRFDGLFSVDGLAFPCDQSNCEVLAAVCGMARCRDDVLVNVYSDDTSVIKWLSCGEEPSSMTALLDCYRRRADGKDVFVCHVPHFEKDPAGNKWNEMCNRLAEEALKG